MLNELSEKLEEIEPNIEYGLLSKEYDVWNYMVIGRRKLQKAGASKTDFNERYFVGIVRENYIPETLPFEVIDKVTTIPGMRLADSDFNYSYISRGKTKAVVEMLILEFVKPKKRG